MISETLVNPLELSYAHSLYDLRIGKCFYSLRFLLLTAILTIVFYFPLRLKSQKHPAKSVDTSTQTESSQSIPS